MLGGGRTAALLTARRWHGVDVLALLLLLLVTGVQHVQAGTCFVCTSLNLLHYMPVARVLIMSATQQEPNSPMSVCSALEESCRIVI